MLTLTTNQKLFIARSMQTVVMAARKLRGQGPELDAKRGRIKWHLDLREGIDFSIWLLGAFEPRTQKQYLRILKPGDVVVDVGANIGAHTLPMARAVGNGGRVIAVEPTDYAFGKLTSNAALNPELRNRITAVQAMLVDKPSDEPAPTIYSSWPLEKSGDVHPGHGGKLQTSTGAQVTTLDDVVKKLGLDRIDMMKIDIDGYECTMLRGALETLGRFKPVLVMEISPYVLDEHGGSIEELASTLADLGYSIRDADTDAPLPLDGAQLRKIVPVGGGRNVVARCR
jgi:FkbM family methyltransferase